MKILVCISKAPDTTTKISFTENNTKFNEDGVKYIINPYDEWYALVRGIELKEANGGSVTTITVGTSEDDSSIRKALAIGADDAIRINAVAEDAGQVATEIAHFAKEGSYDLILLGKETIDYNGAQIASMVAEHLDLPCVSQAIQLNVNGNTATLDKEVVGGVQTVEVDLPLVVSCFQGMTQPRIPNMRGIMAARTKPLKVVEPINATKATTFAKYELPQPKSEVKLIDPENMDELVALLHNEAKVI